MKKNYIQPATTVVSVATETLIAQSVTGLSNSVGMKYGGGNNGAARVKDATDAYDVWDDDWSE